MPSALLIAGPVALAERAVAHALAVLAEAAVVDMTLPTPCPGWDLHRLLLHVADTTDLLAVQATTGERHVPDPPRSAAADPAGVAGARVRHLLETLRSTTQGETDGDDGTAAWAREAACGAAIELTAHAWDIGVVCRPGAQVPDDLAAGVLDLATTLVSDDLRQGFFGPRVDVPPAATASRRLLGFLGRDPAWPVGVRS